MNAKRWLVVVVALGLAWAPACSRAAVLKIGPERLIDARHPLPNGDLVLQTPGWATAMDGLSPAQYYGWAPINLPVGATITKLVCLYRSSSAGGEMSCQVYRYAWGQSSEWLYSTIHSEVSSAYTPCPLTWMGGNHVIEAGYTHYVLVLLKKPASFGGLKIVYTAP